MEPQENTRARALMAIGALAALGVLVGVILVTSGSSESSAAAPAPQECIEAWNSSDDAVSTGVHNRGSHQYARVQVAYAAADGSEVSSSPVPGGGCVVVFAAQALDPEPVAAAEINLDDRWVPMSKKTDLGTLAQLQSDALGAANAVLETDGRVSPLES